ncbi:ATP-grasp domain-containing protein [Streptomyces sp. NBC_01262]|uniref:ATP-grasp domain-containing protein n=1 Tax=Streptomyces sp. NBC_01262 TaxID=2903803 RepID=UPI002E35A8CC|nr:ATP-grasp domain-containing protein [Streptomyces sp. NBC_01262]
MAWLPEEFTGRRIELTTLSEAWALRRPVFVKPPSAKSFPAAVYADGSRLPRTGEGVGPDTPALVSDVVTFAAEYRLFVLDHRVVAGSRYAVHGRLGTAPRRLAERLLASVGESLPSGVTVGVGLVQDPDTGHERWAVVEGNMPWFSHSYTVRVDAVLDVVLRAAGPRDGFPRVTCRSCVCRQHLRRYRGTFYRYVLLYVSREEVTRGQACRDVRSRLRVVSPDPVHR